MRGVVAVCSVLQFEMPVPMVLMPRNPAHVLGASLQRELALHIGGEKREDGDIAARS